MVFWQAPTTAQETAPGWVRSGTAPSINVTLRDHAPGDYRWGVYLVRPDPYVRLRYLGGGYLLHIADGHLGSGGNDADIQK